MDSIRSIFIFSLLFSFLLTLHHKILFTDDFIKRAIHFLMLDNQIVLSAAHRSPV